MSDDMIKVTHAGPIFSIQSAHATFEHDYTVSYEDMVGDGPIFTKYHNMRDIDESETLKYHKASLAEWQKRDDATYKEWRAKNPFKPLPELAYEYTKNDIARWRSYQAGEWYFGVLGLIITLDVSIDGKAHASVFRDYLGGIESNASKDYLTEMLTDMLSNLKAEILSAYPSYADELHGILDAVAVQDLNVGHTFHLNTFVGPSKFLTHTITITIDG